MVKLRLKRMGKKGAPFYRIVAADSRSPRDGRFIEQIGTYNPTKAEEKVTLDKELAKKWLSNGAQPDLLWIVFESDQALLSASRIRPCA